MSVLVTSKKYLYSKSRLVLISRALLENITQAGKATLINERVAANFFAPCGGGPNGNKLLFAAQPIKLYIPSCVISSEK